MKKEESLVKVNDGIFARVCNFFRNIFRGKDKKEEIVVEEENTNKYQAIKDIDVLDGLLHENVDINKVDDKTKERIVTLCNERLEQIRQKIQDIDSKIKEMDTFLAESK